MRPQRPQLRWRRGRRALLSVAAHSPRALTWARRLGADAALLSPVFATASHPGQPGLGGVRFGLWSRRAHLPDIALRGVTAATWKSLPAGSAHGGAALAGLGP